MTFKDLTYLLKRLIREDIQIDYRLSADDRCFIQGDQGQLEQVLINLVTNAQDAMPEGGRLVVETSPVEFAQPVIIQDFSIAPGRYCRIRVQDAGGGIPPEILPHVFEPFFTTKARGKGTGMGLATCCGIVKQHNGYIWPDTDPGKGTTFTVLFPANTPEEKAAPDDIVGSDASLMRSAGERILVVEDELAVRKMAVLALRRRGYQVIEADSPEECIDMVDRGKMLWICC